MIPKRFHRWADVIHAWADGKPIEARQIAVTEAGPDHLVRPLGEWHYVAEPEWSNLCFQFRVMADRIEMPYQLSDEDKRIAMVKCGWPQ